MRLKAATLKMMLEMKIERINKNKLMSITYNNFAWYFKKKNQPDRALEYLNKALEIEDKSILINFNFSKLLILLRKRK